MEYRTLNTGAKMPMAVFGVFQIRDYNTCVQAVEAAVKAGYRAIDTAAVYGNEKAVGEAIQHLIAEGVVKREDLFIISKMWVQDMRNYDMASKAIDTSLKNLGLDYLDLYLEHQAMGNYFEAYRAMEDAQKAGKLKAIGVSNFFPAVLANFCENVNIIPAVNQVELHPWFAQEEALRVMDHYHVVPQAWAALAEGRHGIFTDSDLTAIGKKYGKSAAQVALRWNIQRGVVVSAKSTKPERIKQNLDVFDFALTDNEMQTISKKTLDHSEIINHFDPELVIALNHSNIHA
jgi:diketogulonate reductase-like aldo/keto reductase